MESIADSYGFALYEIAKEDHQLDVYQKDLDFVLSVLDDQAIAFFNQPLIDLKDRTEVLKQCFQDNVQQNVLNFLKLLILKKRFKYLREIVAEYRRLYYQERGILAGTVYSVRELDDELLASLAKALSQKEGKKVVLSQKIDAGLIGGVKVVVQDHVYDGSIKNKMDSLASELLKG